MAIDLAALRAKIAAQKAAQQGVSNEAKVESSGSNTSSSTPVTTTSVAVVNPISTQGNAEDVRVSQAPTVSAPATLGTSKTTEIEHLDFLSKMNSLAEAIHTQHPTMPVLLMQIHKQLRTDPELVTTLDEDAIGVIVRGLQIQTRTELVAEATKTTKKKKNPAVSLDMF
jgi:hypothetical protein